MIEMLHCYWLEVCVVNTDKMIVAVTAKSSSPSSAMFLVRKTLMVVYHMQLVYKLLEGLQVSRKQVSSSRNLDCLASAENELYMKT